MDIKKNMTQQNTVKEELPLSKYSDLIKELFEQYQVFSGMKQELKRGTNK
jgi:hypothetical protein